jgi:hypothetical protein
LFNFVADHKNNFISIYYISSPGFIAGITNPIIETSVGWDLLFDVGSGRVAVHRDIHLNHPPGGGSAVSSGVSGTGSGGSQPLSRTAALKAEGSANSEEDMMNRNSRDSSSGPRSDFVSRPNDSDNLFVEDVSPVSCICTLPILSFFLSSRRSVLTTYAYQS